MQITIRNNQGEKYYLKFENGDDFELEPHSEISLEFHGNPDISIGYNEIVTHNIHRP
jgi:hypothetical protein